MQMIMEIEVIVNGITDLVIAVPINREEKRFVE